MKKYVKEGSRPRTSNLEVSASGLGCEEIKILTSSIVNEIKHQEPPDVKD